MFGSRRREELKKLADSVPYWWHSIDLGKGVITPGVKPLDNLQAELDALDIPNLKGKTALDVGAWDGFFSFHMEKMGASRVVALDHYVWNMDLVQQQEYWQQCRAQKETPLVYHKVPSVWRPHDRPGKIGFDTARKALNSSVESVITDFMDTDLDTLGCFDVVLYKGVLYHIRNPLQALRRLAAVTREVAIVETSAAVFKGFEDRSLCEFFESDELNFDPTNWWAPNLAALHGMCRAAGFRAVETRLGPPEEAGWTEHPVFRYRAIVHAFK